MKKSYKCYLTSHIANQKFFCLCKPLICINLKYSVKLFIKLIFKGVFIVFSTSNICIIHFSSSSKIPKSIKLLDGASFCYLKCFRSWKLDIYGIGIDTEDTLTPGSYHTEWQNDSDDNWYPMMCVNKSKILPISLNNWNRCIWNVI